MKNLIPVILALGLFAPAIGCATLNAPPDPKWDIVAKVVSRRGTYEAVKANPDLRPAFEIAVSALDNLLIQSEVDYDGLVEALQKLPVDELRTDDGALIIRDAIDLYDALVGDELRLREGTQLRSIAISVRDGVRSGLALAPDGSG